MASEIAVALRATADVVDELEAQGLEVADAQPTAVGDDQVTLSMTVGVPLDESDDRLDEPQVGATDDEVAAELQDVDEEDEEDLDAGDQQDVQDDSADESEEVAADDGRDVDEDADPPAEPPLDHTDEDHLEWAYETEDTVKDAAEWFDVGYSAVFRRLKAAGIHEPTQRPIQTDVVDHGQDETDVVDDEEDLVDQEETDDVQDEEPSPAEAVGDGGVAVSSPAPSGGGTSPSGRLSGQSHTIEGVEVPAGLEREEVERTMAGVSSGDELATTLGIPGPLGRTLYSRLQG